MTPVFEKWLCPQRKFIMGKNFQNRDFRFKIRFRPSWIDSDQKIFFGQNFLSLLFLRPVILFFEKMAMSSHNRKNFEIEIFDLKYVLDRSESIPTKKNFSTKIFCLCHSFDLWPHFSKKWLSQVIMGKNFRNRDFHFIVPFGPFWIDSDQKKNFRPKTFICHFFDQKWSKIEVFWRFLVEKKVFQKNFCTHF